MSTGVGMSSCCLSGKIQNGTPKGREEQIGGLETYVAEPEGGSKKKTIIFLVDSTSCLAHICDHCTLRAVAFKVLA